MTLVQMINLSFQIWGSVLSIIILVCMILLRKNDTRIEKIFNVMIILNIAAMLSDAFALYFRGKTDSLSWFGVRISNFMQFAFSSFLAVMFVCYHLAYIEGRNDKPISRFFSRAAMALGTTEIIGLTVNLFYPFIYKIDSDNIYERMPFYPIMYLPYTILLVMNMILLIKYRKLLSKIEIVSFVFNIAVPFISAILSALIYGIVFGYIGMTTTLIIMFFFIQIEQRVRLMKQESQIAQGKIDIMLSRIQPHFLYNTLSSIAVLCKKDSDLAQHAAIKFTEYLRENLDSLKRRELISIEKEISHVESYVWLEQLRFGSDLIVNYDLNDIDFELPAMTIMPIVENSIVHGMMGKDGVCHIDIKAQRLNDSILISITDDGIGFDTKQKKQDNRSHTGIQNVKNRIEYMVSGTLSVESELGKGTVVNITIPIERHE